MPICGDYGGRRQDGEPCRRPVHGSVRCPAHRDRPHLQVTPRQKLFDVSEFQPETRRLWSELLEVFSESERPELYAAVIDFDGCITAERSVDRVRFTKNWLAWRVILRVAERRLEASDDSEMGEILRFVRGP